MQAKDLPADLIVATIKQVATTESNWAFLWDIQDVLSNYPPKVVLAKLKKLVRQGKIEGCTCGCRGDFKVVE